MANGFKVPLPSNADLLTTAGKLGKGMSGGTGSIIKSARSNIFEFPVFISSSVPLDYATATSSLLEQVYASYLQMAISINPIIDNASAVSGHQFDKFKSNTNKYLECVDTSYQVDACHNVLTIDSDEIGYRIEDGKIIEFSLMSIDDNDARYFNEYLNYEPLSEFNHFFQEADKPTPNGRNPHYNNPIMDMNDGRTDKNGDPLPARWVKDPEFNSFAENEKLYYQIENLERQMRDFDQKDKAKGLASGVGGTSAAYDYQTAINELKDLKARVKKNEADAKAADHKASKEVQDQEDRIRNLDEEIKQGQKNKSPVELKKLEHERDLAKKKLDDYEKDREKQQNKIDAEIQKLKIDTITAANKFNLDNEAAKREAAKEAREIAKDERDIEKYEYEKSQREAERRDAANRGRIRAPQMMDETKIQKLNTMKPLMMTVDLNVETKSGDIKGVQYAIGVKCHNRIVDADILPEVVEFPLKEMNKITRKAKWRAGELKFFKDILFQIKQKKQSAIDAKDPKRKWYRRLYDLAHMSGDAPSHEIASGNSILRTFFKGNATHGVIPNATLVISKSDVDVIKRETKIDMLKGSAAAHFCKELFLMGIVVIDYDAESICTLFPDIHNDYEVHSIAAVNKQISILDTSGAKTREAFKMLG